MQAKLTILTVTAMVLSGCDRLPSWLATEKPPAPVPTAAPSTTASVATPEPPSVEWSKFSGPSDAVLEATRITLRVEGKKSYAVTIEHDGTVALSSGGGCGSRTIPTAMIGSLLAFIRQNNFFTFKPTYKTESPPTAQDEVRVGVRTPANDVLVVAERGSKPPQAFTNIASAIATVTSVEAQLPKLKVSTLAQDDVERAYHKDRARLTKCKAASVELSIDKLGVTSLEGITPNEGGPCVLPIVTSWRFAPTCTASRANIAINKAGATVTVTPTL